MSATGAHYVVGSMNVKGVEVPVLSTRLTAKDTAGTWKVRWGIGRDKYRVSPGLYAVGSPTPESPVLVTANYKLTLDSLRKELTGIDAWILVLDTKGVNVWCAAGKGTFGTRELAERLMSVGLERFISHRTLILPQLGASGVSAPLVEKKTGFHVLYGPVRSRDIPAFLAAGMKKDDAMRRVQFLLHDRLTVVPTELAHSWPFLLVMAIASVLFALPFGGRYGGRLLATILPLFGAIVVANVIFPMLLPFIPMRAFSLKGALLGALWAVAAALIFGTTLGISAGLGLVIVAVVSFITMNFTGTTTFTSQTGTELEVRWGLVPMGVALVLGVFLSVGARVFGF